MDVARAENAKCSKRDTIFTDQNLLPHALLLLSSKSPLRRNRQYSPQLLFASQPGSGSLIALLRRGELVASRKGWQ